MDVFKPKIRLRFVWDTDNGRMMICKYYCRFCGSELKLGQSLCSCGVPVVWDGIKEWDDSQFARKKLSN